MAEDGLCRLDCGTKPVDTPWFSGRDRADGETPIRFTRARHAWVTGTAPRAGLGSFPVRNACRVQLFMPQRATSLGT